jgi:hypothetical protein
MTEGAPRAATGTTDAQGKYRLTTFEKDDGAMIGKHTVTIAQGGATSGAGMDAENPDDAAYGAAMGAAASGKPAAAGEEGGIPVNYANPKTSGLEREVTKAGPNQFDFDL